MVGSVEQESFERLLEESLAHARVNIEKGDRVQGRVIGFSGNDAVIDLGAKREALLSLSELTLEGEPLELDVGDEVEGTITSEGDDGEPARLTTQVPKGRLGRLFLADVREAGRTITGVVRGYNRGGLEVQVGGLRAFCPMSQIDVRPPEDLSKFVGERLQFKVHDLRGRQVVISHRTLIDEQRSEKAIETLERLTEGAVVTGTVATLHDFGAFIDLGGLDALLPTSELTRRRISKPSDLLKPDQEVEVQVLRIEPGDARRRARITVSLKALETDPWEEASEWLMEGAAFRGKVVGIQPFGVFVELVPGVDGLIHVSDLGGGEQRVDDLEKRLPLGSELDVLVGPVDWENRRVSLIPISLPGEAQPQVSGREGMGSGSGRDGNAQESSGSASAAKAKDSGLKATLAESLREKAASREE
jgi:small subunit ribosomal protein S1